MRFRNQFLSMESGISSLLLLDNGIDQKIEISSNCFIPISQIIPGNFLFQLYQLRTAYSI